MKKPESNGSCRSLMRDGGVIEENGSPLSLPPGWASAKVGELYDIVGGGTPSTSVPEYWNGDIPWITSADIHGLKDIRPRKQISRVGIENSATNIAPSGSLIVVTRVGLGKMALTDVPLCFSQDSHALIGNAFVVYPLYALYYLSKAVQAFKQDSRGTTIQGVTKRQLAELAVALPPLAEQHRIVEKVEELLAKVNAARRHLEKVAALFGTNNAIEKRVAEPKPGADKITQAILAKAFRGELVTTEAELARRQSRTYEPASVLLERIKAERKAGKPGTKIKSLAVGATSKRQAGEVPK